MELPQPIRKHSLKESRSSSFMAVARNDTTKAKVVQKGPGYNMDFDYVPKYNFVKTNAK